MQPTIICRVLEAQKKDQGLQQWFTKVSAKEPEELSISSDGSLKCRNRLCVPDIDHLRKGILDEAHKPRLMVHPGGTKMYQDLKRNFWWEGLKRQLVFVSCGEQWISSLKIMSRLVTPWIHDMR